jgi:hypothetical protein
MPVATLAPRTVKAPMPAGPTSPGLLAAYGFGPARQTPQGRVAKVAARRRTQVAVPAGTVYGPRGGAVPECRCDGCGTTWVQTARVVELTCLDCGSAERTHIVKWLPTVPAPRPAAGQAAGSAPFAARKSPARGNLALIKPQRASTQSVGLTLSALTHAERA